MFKSTLGGLALVGIICLSVPLAQAKTNKVPIQNLTIVQEKGTSVANPGGWHHHHHHHHHHWHHHHDHHHHHHHGVSGANSGTELPAPQVDVK
jgi:G3E family GTPase